MNKVLALIMAMAMVTLTACQTAPPEGTTSDSSGSASEGSSGDTTSEGEPSEFDWTQIYGFDPIFDEEPVRTDVEFFFEDLPDPGYIVSVEPIFEANTYVEFGFGIPDEYDVGHIGDDAIHSRYEFVNYPEEELLGYFVVRSAPIDPQAHFKTEDPDVVQQMMESQFFTTESTYKGLKKNIVEDFEYDLKVDWRGMAFGAETFYMEFEDTEGDNYGMRFFLSNDQINEAFYSIEVKVDIPLDEVEERLPMLRSILFSMYNMG